MKALKMFLSGLLILGAGLVHAVSRPKPETTSELSRDAYIWGYPLVFMSHVKKAMLSKTRDPEAAINHLFQATQVPDPFLGRFFSINPENLYAWAWADLSQEPLVFTHPQITDRFYSIQFVDAYSNVFHTISNSTQGNELGTFVVTPPGWRGALPENTHQIRSSTPEVFILAQTFVEGGKDARKMVQILSQRRLIPLSLWKQGPQTWVSEKHYPDGPVKLNRNLAIAGLQFYQDLQKIVAKNPPPTRADEMEWARFSRLGLRDKEKLEAFAANLENWKLLDRGLFEGERSIQDRLANGVGTKINGWNYEIKALPFAEDYLLRAAASQRHLFSLPAQEILQMSLDVDSESRQLFSNHRYILHFEKEDFPPSRNMWSLRVHEMKKANPEDISRPMATLNERTAQLKSNLDGSVDILLQQEKPPLSLRSNWMPLSKNANFYVVLTIFNPSHQVLDRKYIAPSLTRLDDEGVPKQRVTHTMIAESRATSDSVTGTFSE